jgi:MFS family permease/LysM repeat protein
MRLLASIGLALAVAAGVVLSTAPPARASSQPHDPTGSYTVQSGDNLGTIARRCQTTVEAVYLANRWIEDPAHIEPGWEIAIPLDDFEVGDGHNLYTIGRWCGVDWRRIAARNAIPPPYTIWPGQRLILPPPPPPPAPDPSPPPTEAPSTDEGESAPDEGEGGPTTDRPGSAIGDRLGDEVSSWANGLLLCSVPLVGIAALAVIVVRRRRRRRRGEGDHRAAHVPSRRAALLVACLTSGEVGIDYLIFQPALRTLVVELGATQSDLTWVSNAYAVTFAGLIGLAGALSPRFGDRRQLLWGHGIFALGAVIGVFATQAAGLVGAPAMIGVILARGVMGAGAAPMLNASHALVMSKFKGAGERNAVIAWSASTILGVAGGSMIGAQLVVHMGWRAIFGSGVALALVALVATWVIVNERQSANVDIGGEPEKARIDGWGAGLLVAFLGLLVYGLIQIGETEPWTAFLCIVAAIAALVILVPRGLKLERSGGTPALRLSLLANRTFRGACVLSGLVWAFLLGAAFVMALYLGVERFPADPVAIGTVVLPLGTALVGAVFAMKAKGNDAVIVADGLALIGLALLLASRFDIPTGKVTIMVAFGIVGNGIGRSLTILTALATSQVPVEHRAAGAALYRAFGSAFGAAGVALMSVLLSINYTNTIDLTAVPEAHREETGRGLANAAILADHLFAAGDDSAGAVYGAATAAFIPAMRSTLTIGAGLALVAALLALWVLRGVGQQSADPGEAALGPEPAPGPA